MFPSVVSNVLTKGRKERVLIAKIIAVIVEGESKGDVREGEATYIIYIL